MSNVRARARKSEYKVSLLRRYCIIRRCVVCVVLRGFHPRARHWKCIYFIEWQYRTQKRQHNGNLNYYIMCKKRKELNFVWQHSFVCVVQAVSRRHASHEPRSSALAKLKKKSKKQKYSKRQELCNQFCWRKRRKKKILNRKNYVRSQYVLNGVYVR